MTRFDFLVKFFATQHDNYRYTRSRTVEPWYSDRGPVSLSVCLSACKKINENRVTKFGTHDHLGHRGLNSSVKGQRSRPKADCPCHHTLSMMPPYASRLKSVGDWACLSDCACFLFSSLKYSLLALLVDNPIFTTTVVSKSRRVVAMYCITAARYWTSTQRMQRTVTYKLYCEYKCQSEASFCHIGHHQISPYVILTSTWTFRSNHGPILLCR